LNSELNRPGRGTCISAPPASRSLNLEPDHEKLVASAENPYDRLSLDRLLAGCALTNYEPDILAKDLDVIFCGLNPASSAAAAGYNFSNRSNRFWRVLHLANFTDVRLQPQDERRLLEYGCGITAIVRRPTRRAAEVSPEEFRQARRGFEAKMRQYAPHSIAFLGKRAFSIMIGQPEISWGRQQMNFAGTMTWVLPNPSGLNRSFALDALVSAYGELRLSLQAWRSPRTDAHPRQAAAQEGRSATRFEI
jgi:TDG/mug DNA glycosylase family protein